MPEGESPRIVIPAGRFDEMPARPAQPTRVEAGSQAAQQEKKFPEMKPLNEIDIDGLGHYTIGVPSNFEGNSFQLTAVDDDRESIPLMTIQMSRDASGATIYSPVKNQAALDFFGDHLDVDGLMQQFSRELDSFLKSKMR